MASWWNMMSRRNRRSATAAAHPAPPEAKAAAPLIAFQANTSARWAPRNYAAFAREGVMRNAVVYRCVRLIAEAAASVPIAPQARDETSADLSAVARLLAKPAPGVTGTDVLECWYGYLLVSGNAYMQAVSAGGVVRGLQVLRPDRVTVCASADGWPEAYEYQSAGRRVVLPREHADGTPSVLHLRLFHPEDDHYGLSPIEAAATAVDIHNGASQWNKALLDNAARPSGALVYAAGEHMTAEQFDRLKSELEESFQGARKAGRPLLLEGGLDWKSMSLSPRDMDFIAAKNAAAREIALALGVPPMLLGIPGDNTYANYQEANRTFWRQTVLPLVNRTARALSVWLEPVAGAPFTLQPDLDAVEALSPEREALWRRLEAVSFLSEAEKRAVLNYPPRAVDPPAADG
jgi:HK97 family phage portal protein